jgi:hypothetical protein
MGWMSPSPDAVAVIRTGENRIDDRIATSQRRAQRGLHFGEFIPAVVATPMPAWLVTSTTGIFRVLARAINSIAPSMMTICDAD